MDQPVSSEAAKRHDSSIDLCKGVAILLVVLGHAIQHNVSQYDQNFLFRLIYSFHMPLFFILSGMVTNPDTPGRIARSAKRLLLPALCWYLVQYVLGRFYESSNPGAYLLSFVVSPDNGLWFLWVLFFIIALFVAIRKAERRFGTWAYPAAIVLLYAVPVNRFGLHLMKYYLPFFLLGYLTTRYPLWWQARRRQLFLLSALVYPVAFPLWHRTADQAGINKAHLLQAGIALVSFIGVRYLVGLSGSLIAIFLLKAVNGVADLSVLRWIGKQSLEIYACQFVGLELLHGKGVFTIVLAFIVALLISLLAANTLGRIRYVNVLLFGRSL